MLVGEMAAMPGGRLVHDNGTKQNQLMDEGHVILDRTQNASVALRELYERRNLLNATIEAAERAIFNLRDQVVEPEPVVIRSSNEPATTEVHKRPYKKGTRRKGVSRRKGLRGQSKRGSDI